MVFCRNTDLQDTFEPIFLDRVGSQVGHQCRQDLLVAQQLGQSGQGQALNHRSHTLNDPALFLLQLVQQASQRTELLLGHPTLFKLLLKQATALLVLGLLQPFRSLGSRFRSTGLEPLLAGLGLKSSQLISESEAELCQPIQLAGGLSHGYRTPR